MSLTTGDMTAADLAAVVGNDRNNGFGGDGLYGVIVLFILLAMLNGGMGFGGGFGNAADGAMLYPWMNQAEVTQAGFAAQATNSAIQGLQSSVTSGFGDTALGIAGINQNICQTGNGITAAISNGFQNAETSATARQMANMQQAFGAQTAVTGAINGLQSDLASCCCENRLATVQTQNVMQSEAAANRYASAENTRDIIESQNRNSQAILDKLCQLELDGVKAQVEAKNDRIAELQTQLTAANFNASQAAQNAFFAQGMNNEVDALYNRLKNCPVPTQPVYGNQPIFTCGGGSCGCNGNF